MENESNGNESSELVPDKNGILEDRDFIRKFYQNRYAIKHILEGVQLNYIGGGPPTPDYGAMAAFEANWAYQDEKQRNSDREAESR